MPTEHDGQSAFSFRVEFSEDIETSYQTLRDESFSVTDGDVTGARRVDGRHDLWEITVEPESREVVTISLPGGSACGTAGAVCTLGNDPRPLSNSPSATVAGPPSDPLTASFGGMPAEHAGEGTFTFGLTFSEEVELNYVTLRDAAFSVSGGAVRKAEREQQGSNVAWEITVEPVSAGAVTIGLPETTDCDASGAICTADERALSHSLSATIAGPVGIAVADARVDEAADALLAFAVTLSRAASGTVTVDFATADGKRAGGRGLHGGPRHAHLPGRRNAADGQRDGARRPARRGRGDADAVAVERLGRPADGRRGDRDDRQHEPAAAGAAARFGRAAAVHVVEHVEDWRSAFGVRSAYRNESDFHIEHLRATRPEDAQSPHRSGRGAPRLPRLGVGIALAALGAPLLLDAVDGESRGRPTHS